MTFKPDSVVKRLEPDELEIVLNFLWERWPNKEKIPQDELIKSGALAKSWINLMLLGVARSYALFSGSKPVALLLGLFSPDLRNGDLQGVEYLMAGPRAVKLLDMFEQDCREKGCTRVVCGFHVRVFGQQGKATRRLYRKKGYEPYTESFSKLL